MQEVSAVRYIRYDLTTGQILSWGSVPSTFLSMQERPGQGVLEADVTAETHYIDILTLQPHLLGVMALSVSGGTISSIPIGSFAEIDGTQYAVNDGVLEISSPVSITKTVKITHPHYQPTTVEVTL